MLLALCRQPDVSLGYLFEIIPIMKLILFIPLLLLSFFNNAQTSLGPGDVAFTMINMDGSNEDALAFVLLKDVSPNTKIVVTDDEYTSGLLTTGEGRVEITFTVAFSCGTEIFIQDVNPDISIYDFRASTGPGNSTGLSTANVGSGDLSLGINGETLIAFQDANPNTTSPASFISALANTGGAFGSSATGSSELPPGLVIGQSALALPANPSGEEFDNYKYNCVLTSGTPGQLAGGIYTAGNWNGSDATGFPVSGCGFTCQASCTDPVLTALSSNPATPCPNTAVTISITGSRNNAPNWELRTGSCTGPVITTTTGNSFTVTPASTTTYFVTALKCDNSRVCLSTTITTSSAAANAGPDQLLVSGTTATLAGSSPAPGTGAWTVAAGPDAGNFANAASATTTFTGTAGQSYLLRWSVTSPCGNSSDDVEISFAQGSTDLVAGDLAFIGYNSSAPDEFSFILLREVNAGTELFFTDMGWLQAGGFRTSAEGLISLTLARNYRCGDAFYLTRTPLSGNNWEAFDESGSTAGMVSIPAIPGLLPDVGATGDQLFAFQGSLAAPTLLAGIHVGSPWSDAIDSGTSAQPPALAGNNTSVNLTQDLDNGIYNCVVTSSSPVELRSAINNATNWTTSDVLIPLTPTCDFACQACNEPVLTNLSVTPNPVCPGEAITITITGDLMGATRWVVYAPADCGGTELGTSTGGNTITFTPVGSGAYLVAGIDGCVATPVCAPVTITQTGVAAEITMPQPTTKVFATSVALTATPLGGGQTGTWSIVSGSDNGGAIADPSGPAATLSGTAGNNYLLRYTVTGNGCPATTDEVFVSFLVNGGVSFGGMVFTGYNSQPTDNFSVVVLESLLAGTSFSVTDKGWLAAGGFGSGENTANYLLCRPLSCGDEVRFEADGKGYAPDGSVVAEIQAGSSFPAISSAGDQLFLYSGVSEPTAGDQSGFVSAIQMNCENGTCSEGNWDGDATDTGSSAKPAAFAASGSIFGGTAPSFNGRYDCANGTSNNLDLFALVTNDANWSFQNTAVSLADCGFTCDPPPVAVCQDITVEIDANGNPTTNGQPFTASDLDGGSTDNGSIDPNGFSVDITPGCANVTNPSTTTITLTVTDDLGQTATCTSQVTVEDNVAPVVTCQNVVVDLLADGTFNSGGFGSFFINNVLTSFTDNCAPAPNGLITGFQFSFGCNDIGINNEGYFFRDRPNSDPTRLEDRCDILLQVNDPLGVCGSDPIVNCQDFAAGPDPDGTYTLDANSLNNGSTDDRSVYTLVFDPATDRQEHLIQDCTYASVGQGQSFTAGQDGVIQTIRVRSVTAVSTTLHLYAGDNGSGVPGSVGTPLYSQAVELFASPTGAFTEMLLSTPFPVTAGSQYNFVLEGTTNLYYDCGATAGYPGGRTMLNYVQWPPAPDQDYTFQVDIIGPTTQEFTGDGDYPLTVYAVDDQGNVSGACNATFTLDQSLPVEWLSFGADAGAKQVDLQWETTPEPDNAGFHVERSATGNEWLAIGQVTARPGPNQRYDFTDNAPLNGTSYYRLRQTDLDGRVTYSPVETVVFYGEDFLEVFPNPATDEVNVRLPAGAEILGLLDVTGRNTRIIFDGQDGQRKANVSGLPAGVYFLRVRLADGGLGARRGVVR